MIRGLVLMIEELAYRCDRGVESCGSEFIKALDMPTPSVAG